jgi:flagellar biosynthesis protein FliR
MIPYETPIVVFFLLFLRHVCLIVCIRPLRGVLGVSGVMVLSTVLSFWLYPEDILHKPIEDSLSRPLPALVFKEAVLGLCIGMPCALVFEAVPFIGRLIDTFRGVQFAEQIAPELGPRDSMLESYGAYLALWFFFEGMYAKKWIALLISIESTFPVMGSFQDPDSKFLFHRDALETFLGDFFVISLLVIIPLVLISLSFELVLSVLQKLSSKFSLGVELSMLRAGLGVFFLMYVLYSGIQLPYQLHRLTASGLAMINQLFITG